MAMRQRSSPANTDPITSTLTGDSVIVSGCPGKSLHRTDSTPQAYLYPG
ncbi:MAG: hypothetical protein KAH54_09300 [Candidatus Sabulitectum sp.]|nr:hypothetical protein [Candidatus Sabulitectum sp.]